MPAAAIGTLAFVALLVVALAATLLWVVVLLRRITGTLGEVCAEVEAVADRTAPLNEAIAAVNADLRAIADGLEGLVHQGGPGQAEADELPAQHR